MTDAVFEVKEDLLLSKRPSRIRERQVRDLELQALIEEIESPLEVYPAPRPGTDAYWGGFGNA